MGQDYRGKHTEWTLRQRSSLLTGPNSYSSKWSRNWRSSSAAYTADDEDLNYGDRRDEDDGEDADYKKAEVEEPDGELYSDLHYSLDDLHENQVFHNDDDEEENDLEEAYASYLDARRRLAEIKSAERLLPCGGTR